MKLYTVIGKDKTAKAAVRSAAGDHLYPASLVDERLNVMSDLIELISDDRSLYDELEDLSRREADEIGEKYLYDEEKLLAPIVKPAQDIICLGINYMAHAEEASKFHGEAFGGERPATIYFSKRVTEAVAPRGEIQSHSDIVDSLDYEAELAVVIGKTCRNVRAEDVKDHIFGYTIINDVSARNIQTRHRQWYFGKSLDGFTPMGPCILTADETAYPPALSVRSRVNGELRQDGNSSLFISDIDHVVSELSQGMTLLPGTIISMGTPAGVGMGFDPPRFLSPGDVVECEVECIGKIVNKIS